MSANKLNQQSNTRNKQQSPSSTLNNSFYNYHSHSELKIKNLSPNETKSTSFTTPTSPNSTQLKQFNFNKQENNLFKLNDEIQCPSENNRNLSKIIELNDSELTQELNDNKQIIENQFTSQITNEIRNQITDKVTNQITNQVIDKDNRPNDKQETKDGITPKDSPAFRLRARRSTPRKLDSIYSPYPASRKFSLYSPNNSNQLQVKVAKLKSGLNEVKRNLFDNSNDSSDLNVNKELKRKRSHSPSRSLVEDIDLNVFAENVLLDKLTVDTGKNNFNYLSLRIIEVQEEVDQFSLKNSKEGTKNNQSPNKYSPSNDKLSPKLSNNSSTKQRLLKLYCQQAETKGILNVQKPVVILYLFNEYVDFKDRLLPGKILEIVKFEIKKLPSNQLTKYKQNSNEVDVYPFYIELKPDRSNDWIPLISIKKKFEPTNSNLLNVINTQNRFQNHENIEDQPPTKNPKVVFSSYVVKNESIEQNNQQNLQNTKSPTIRRFMKTITKSYAQPDSSKLKLKIKK